ncbi:hypothetical protein MRX96_059191 [Rhipicephalus microplus]
MRQAKTPVDRVEDAVTILHTHVHHKAAAPFITLCLKLGVYRGQHTTMPRQQRDNQLTAHYRHETRSHGGRKSKPIAVKPECGDLHEEPFGRHEGAIELTEA